MADWYILATTQSSGEPNQAALLNLDVVQTVEVISPTSVRVRFRENETISLEGQPALDLVQYLMAKGVRFGSERR
jgi:hypothetical protein